MALIHESLLDGEREQTEEWVKEATRIYQHDRSDVEPLDLDV